LDSPEIYCLELLSFDNTLKDENCLARILFKNELPFALADGKRELKQSALAKLLKKTKILIALAQFGLKPKG
jgi:hypothetical protein